MEIGNKIKKKKRKKDILYHFEEELKVFLYSQFPKFFLFKTYPLYSSH